MDYTGTLDWLKNLLTTNQGTQSNQFNQGLGFNKEQLAQQGSQFDANLALQKVIADWQNQLAGRAQTQSEQGQQFNQNLQTKETGFPFMATTGALSRINSPQNQAATSSWIDDFLKRIGANSMIPLTGQRGDSYDPYANKFYSSVGIPVLNSGPAPDVRKVSAPVIK